MGKISVKVMGKNIDISADESEQLYFLKIAEYINERYERVAKNPNIVPDTHLRCSLTTLEITRELFKIKSLQGTVSNNYEKKLNELIKQLEL
jgi:cell division protein ZapA (FtsZ GTPase activity inhibitor)